MCCTQCWLVHASRAEWQPHGCFTQLYRCTRSRPHGSLTARQCRGCRWRHAALAEGGRGGTSATPARLLKVVGCWVACGRPFRRGASRLALCSCAQASCTASVYGSVIVTVHW
jgi:hypothetical protein